MAIIHSHLTNKLIKKERKKEPYTTLNRFIVK